MRRKHVTLEYDQYSNTIRQMPQNYCVAVQRNNRWILDFDLACSKRLTERVLSLLFDFDILYGDGDNLVKQYKRKYKIPIY